MVEFRVISDRGKPGPHANSMDRAREAMALRPGWSLEGSLCEDRRRETACCSVRDTPEIPLTPHAGDWQMLAAVLVAHLQLDPHSGLSLDQHLRQGTRGRPRPESARLEARTLIRRPLWEVNFIGRPASQRRMRPMVIVPVGKPKQLLPERPGTERHQESSGTLDLECVMLMPFQKAKWLILPLRSCQNFRNVSGLSGKR